MLSGKYLIAGCVLLTSNVVLAEEYTSPIRSLSLDYRHEYRVRDRTHYDKLNMSAALPGNYNFAIETKYKTGGDDPQDKWYDDPVINAVELTLSKSFTFGNFKIAPLIQPEFNSERTEWKFGFVPWYTFNENWAVGGMYRFEMTDYANDPDCGYNGDKSCSTNKHRTVNRGDLYLRYTLDRFSTTYKFIYKHGDEILWGNQHYDYEQEWQFDYTLGDKKEWKPYVTFGDIGRSSRSTERQFRLRMGVVYTFK